MLTYDARKNSMQKHWHFHKLIIAQYKDYQINMQQLKSPSDRLKHFIEIAYANHKTKFAEAAGQSLQQVSMFLNDKRNIGVKSAYSYEIAGCNPTWLLYGEGSMFANNDLGQELSDHQISPTGNHNYSHSVRLSELSTIFNLMFQAGNVNIQEDPKQYIITIQIKK